MLGYVRCATEELKVKHLALYQAMYCGLCHSIEKNASKMLLPFFSYDFVFLAFLRILATKESIEVEKQFCLLHPLKNKKKRICDNDALRFSARAALFLTCEKMKDDRKDRDTSFGRRFLSCVWLPILQRACRRTVRKNPELKELLGNLSVAMEEGRRLEKEGACLDDMCSSFAKCLSAIFSFGTDGEVSRILVSIGEYLGRYIYTLDAIDDLERDEKSASFNPLLLQYGSAQEAKAHFADLDLVLSYYVSQMKLALDLLDGDKELFAVCENIICLGLSRVAGNIMKPNVEKKQ